MSNSAIPPVAIPPTPPSGADTQVQFNDAGAFGGDAGMTYNKTLDKLSVGIVVGNGAVPLSGTTGQALTKVSNTDYDIQWSASGNDLNFVYTQVAPSATWSVPHNLGKFTSVEVVDSGGSVIIPNISYIDSNNVTLSFGSATSGKAYFN